MTKKIKLLMIDNYDSFTYNIVQYFGELGAQVEVFRNDEITLDEIEGRLQAGQLDRLVVSPGPNSLQPTVMLYAPESSKMDAPIVDLSAEADLKIVEAIRPNALAPEVMAWLNPEKRLSYFYSINYAIRDGAA